MLMNYIYCALSWLRARFSKMKKCRRESLLVRRTSTVRAAVASMKSCAGINKTKDVAEWHYRQVGVIGGAAVASMKSCAGINKTTDVAEWHYRQVGVIGGSDDCMGRHCAIVVDCRSNK